MQHRDPWALAWKILKAAFAAWASVVVVAACAIPLDSLPGWAVAVLVTPGLLAMLLHGIAWWSDSSTSRNAPTTQSQSDD